MKVNTYKLIERSNKLIEESRVRMIADLEVGDYINFKNERWFCVGIDEERQTVTLKNRDDIIITVNREDMYRDIECSYIEATNLIYKDKNGNIVLKIGEMA